MQDRRRMAGEWLVAQILAVAALALLSPRPARAKGMNPPVVSRVVFQGAKHLNEEELAALAGVVPGMRLNPTVNKEACQKIVERLQEYGRPFATCQLQQGGNATDTEVIFQITEGPRVRIREVRFEGTNFVSGARLKTKIQGPGGGCYLSRVVDADAGSLATYYRGFGFRDVAVSHELQYAPDGRDVILIFHIQEGLRYRKPGVPEVIGVQSVPHDQLEAVPAVRASDFVDDGNKVKEMESNPKYIRRSGGFYDRVKVEYQVEESSPARVGQVTIIGTEKASPFSPCRNIPVEAKEKKTRPKPASPVR